MAYTTINKPTDYFNTKLYTGNGSSSNAITGVGFQSDFVWIKSRVAAHDHLLQDAVRGVLKTLNSNDTSADDTISNGLTAFGSDGFTVGGNGSFNSNTDNYASWNWKANGAGAANTDGDINSTVSANTTAGFSIVKYTGASNANGATIGHGLGAVPKMIIVKETSSSGNNWIVYHHKLPTGTNGVGSYLMLNSTASYSDSTIMFGNTAPTSAVFSLANDSQTNGSGSTFIAYCFAEKTGYSKFGSYVGNGSTDGTFVYTGFKPAFVIQKNISYTSNWILYDNKRDVDNVADKILIPNTNSAEASACDVDLLSNGFKFRAVNNASSNWSGNTFIYMAFAEAPLVGTNNVPNTAR